MPRQLSVFLSSLLILGMIQLDRQVFAQSPKEIINSIGIKLVLNPWFPVFFILAFILAFVSFLWSVERTGRNNRLRSVAKQLEPLGFTILKSFEPEDHERFYSFLNDGLWMLHSPFFVAVLESDGIRIVAAEFTVGKGARASFIMGSTKKIEAPSMIIRRNSAGSKFLGIANLDAVWFAEDQEFQQRYVVRGKRKDEIRAFLTPQRRKAILDEPGFFTGVGLSGDSILIEYNQRFSEETSAEEVDKCVAMTSVVSRMCQKGS
jgi:hypothetical protein